MKWNEITGVLQLTKKQHRVGSNILNAAERPRHLKTLSIQDFVPSRIPNATKLIFVSEAIEAIESIESIEAIEAIEASEVSVASRAGPYILARGHPAPASTWAQGE